MVKDAQSRNRWYKRNKYGSSADDSEGAIVPLYIMGSFSLSFLPMPLVSAISDTTSLPISCSEAVATACGDGSRKDKEQFGTIGKAGMKMCVFINLTSYFIFYH